MYERMLDKQTKPTLEDMSVFCGGTGELFIQLNEWIAKSFDTHWEIVFPYGNKYGWGVAHKQKKKLVCNVFAEDNAFTIMMRLSDKQYQSVYAKLRKYAQDYIDNKFPCGDGGWIHYRIACREHVEDVQTLLAANPGYRVVH